MSKENLGLLAAAVALITALVSLSIALVNNRGLANQQRQLAAQSDELRALAARIALDITIQRPRAGEVLPPVYDGMSGLFMGRIPIGYRLWVLGRDRFNYFLVYPPTQVVLTEQRWSQSNVRLPTLGSWELLVCIGNEVASKWLQGRADGRDSSGFSVLPDGLEVLRTVAVTR